MGGSNDNNMHLTINKKEMMGHKIATWLFLGIVDLGGIGLFVHTLLATLDTWKALTSFLMFFIWFCLRSASLFEDIKKKRIENAHREHELFVKKDEHEYTKNTRANRNSIPDQLQ